MIEVWEVFPESFQIITGWRTLDHGARIEKKWLPKFDFIAVVGKDTQPRGQFLQKMGDRI